MAWFQDFIDNVVSKWLNNQKLLKEAAQARTSPKRKGDIGEEFVLSLLVAKDYEPGLSPGSKSPADVWGFNSYKDFAHIALIQTKTAVKQVTPEDINEDVEQELRDFASFVWDSFQPLKNKTQSLSSLSLIVSAGYAGVIGRTRPPTLYEARYVGCYYSGDFDENEINKWLEAFHTLKG